MKMTKKQKEKAATAVKYAAIGAIAMYAYKKMYGGEKAASKSGLAMNLGGLALQANPGHYGALHTNPHCKNNPACMGAINLGGIHLGGAHKSGAHLGGIHMGGAHLGGIHMGGAHMGGAHLSGLHLGSAHMGAIHLGGAHMAGMHANPGYMSGAHMGGVVKKGMSNRRSVQYHG